MSIFEKSEKLQKCVGLECINLTHSAKGGKCQIEDWHKMLSVWMNLCPETSPANDACVIWIFQQIFWIFQQIFWIFQQICKTPIHPSHSDSYLQLSPTPIELQFHLKLDRPTLNLCNLKAKKCNIICNQNICVPCKQKLNFEQEQRKSDGKYWCVKTAQVLTEQRIACSFRLYIALAQYFGSCYVAQYFCVFSFIAQYFWDFCSAL